MILEQMTNGSCGHAGHHQFNWHVVCRDGTGADNAQ